MANSVDPDQMPGSVASDLILHSLLFAEACLSQYLGLLWYLSFLVSHWISQWLIYLMEMSVVNLCQEVMC